MAPRKNIQHPEAISNDIAKAEINKKYELEKQKPNKIKPHFLIHFPEPEEVEEQLINLADLEDPPDDFQIKDLTNRWPEMPSGVALLRFHFWNINPGLVTNGSGRFNAFRKLFYNQDEQHRPQAVDELADMQRDAGPRLLKPEILQKLNRLPISRHHPDFPEGTDWEEQRTRPTVPVVAPKENNNGSTPNQDGTGLLIQEQVPPNLGIIRETLERLLIRLRYQDLEIPRLDSNGEQGNTLVNASSYNKYSPPQRVSLFLDTNHNVDPTIEGMQYLCHERGPVGDVADGSETRFDCILMAGKLLDAGLTKVDMDEFVVNGMQETSAHQMFANMVNFDWTLAPAQQNKGMRAALHQFCHSLEPADFTDLLNKVTILRQQFVCKNTPLLLCEKNHEHLGSRGQSTLARLENGYESQHYAGLGMQQVLQSIFQQQGPAPLSVTTGSYIVCDVTDCRKDMNRMIIRRSMPLRLALSLPSDVSPDDHTSDDIRIKTFNEQGNEEVVVYRWLGGIYSDTEIESDETHYRVYWTDAIRGERPTKSIRMYDPRYAQGQVIEGIAPSQKGQIPDAWWQGKLKPVLFYERVLDPDPLDVTLAAAVLGDMYHAIRNELYVLKVHEPWKTMSPMSNATHCNGHENEGEEMQEADSLQVDGQHSDFLFVPYEPPIVSPVVGSQPQVQMPNMAQSSGGNFPVDDGEVDHLLDLLDDAHVKEVLAASPGVPPQTAHISRNGNINQGMLAQQSNPAVTNLTTQTRLVDGMSSNTSHSHHVPSYFEEPSIPPNNRVYNRGGLRDSLQNMHLNTNVFSQGPAMDDYLRNNAFPGNNIPVRQQNWNPNYDRGNIFADFPTRADDTYQTRAVNYTGPSVNIHYGETNGNMLRTSNEINQHINGSHKRGWGLGGQQQANKRPRMGHGG